MSNHTYRVLEYAGTSPLGYDAAIKNAVDRAAREQENLRWFQVVELRGHIDHGTIAHWQVVLKIGTTLPEVPNPAE